MSRITQHPHFFALLRQSARALRGYRASDDEDSSRGHMEAQRTTDSSVKVADLLSRLAAAADGNDVTERFGWIVESNALPIYTSLRPAPADRGIASASLEGLRRKHPTTSAIQWGTWALHHHRSDDGGAPSSAAAVRAHFLWVCETYRSGIDATAGMRPRARKAAIRAELRRWLTANLVGLNYAMLAIYNGSDSEVLGSLATMSLRREPMPGASLRGRRVRRRGVAVEHSVPDPTPESTSEAPHH